MKKLEVYDATSTPSKTLTSIAVSGLPDKMEYYVGEDFECKGLTVTGTYDDKSTATITSGITWTATPEAFTEASESASVSVTAKVGEIESNPFVINGIVVKEKVVPTGYASVYTSNVELTAGENSVAAVIKYDGGEYDGVKCGQSSKAGSCTTNIPAATKTLHFHAIGWNGATSTTLTVNGVEYTITPDNGIASNPPFTLTGDAYEYYYTFDPQGATEITFASSKRFVVFGVNAELAEGAVSTPSFSPSETDFDGSVEVSLTCDTEGADIFYCIGSEVTSLNAIQYTEPFTISETSTIYAVAKKGDKESEQASKTYKKIPSFASLAELLEKLPAQDASVKVSVTLTDIPIESFYVTSGGNKNGVYTNVNGTTVELYEYDVPETWQVGGTLSGKIIGDWLSYNGTPELQKWEGGWDILKYTPPRTHDVTITAAGYATAYIPFNATVSGATAYYVTVEGTSAKLNEITGTIPANTGIVLKGEEGTAKFTESAETPATVTGNLLVGTTADGGQTFGETADTKYYILSKVDEKVGFYWDNTTNNEGTSAKCAQYKAVLAVPKSAGIKSFYLFDDEATGILKVNESAKQQDYKLYNLNGQVVGSDYEGIVIVNGKKMLNK